MLVATPAEQLRCRRADAPARGGVDQRFAQRRMLGEAEIVVAGEVEEPLAGDRDVRAVDGFDRAQAPHERGARVFGVTSRKTFE